MVPILKKLPWLFFWATIATALLLFAQTTVNVRALRLTASPTVQPCSFSVFGVDVTNKVLWACDAGTWFRTWAAPGPPTAADQVVTSSAAGAAAWGQINGGVSCGDGTHALNYTTGTHLIGCQTLTGAGGGAMTQIGQTVLGSPAATITFSAIPGTYTDLMVSLVARGSAAALTQNAIVQFNGDTAANYNWVFSSANNGTSSLFGQTNITIATIPAASASANVPGATTFTVYAYAGTTFNKAVNSRAFFRSGTSGVNEDTMSFSGDWNSTVAITSLTLGLSSAGNFVTGTTATLWGVK